MDKIFDINFKNITTDDLNDVNTPLVISYENKFRENINSQNFELTLKNNKWKYIFIGEGENFINFSTRMNSYYNFLKTLHDEKVVILSDARDVICLRDFVTFMSHLQQITDLNKKIIVSTEMFLMGHMDWSDQDIDEATRKNPNCFYQGIHMKKYWKYYELLDKLPLRKYLNAGLMVGKVKNLIKSFEWIISKNIIDDQLGFSLFTDEHPEMVHLDYNTDIIHTSRFGVNGCLYDNNRQKHDSPTLSELFGLSCYFLHIPGINNSKGQKKVYELIYKILNSKFIENNTMPNLYGIKINSNIKCEYFKKDKL